MLCVHEPKDVCAPMMRSLQSLLVLLGCVSAIAYFGHHTVSGAYGLDVQARLERELALAERRRQGLEAVRDRLKRDIALLNQSPPDADMVEELAQHMLGFAYRDDRIIVVTQDN